MVSRMYLKLAVKALRSRRLTIRSLKISKNDIFTKDKRWVFESYYAKSKNRHLVYEFFDTSQGGYHPQMEPAVNTIIYQRG